MFTCNTHFQDRHTYFYGTFVFSGVFLTISAKAVEAHFFGTDHFIQQFTNSFCKDSI